MASKRERVGNEPDWVFVVFDTRLKRPACALLQAALGGSPGIASNFPGKSWLLVPTPDMRCFRATPEELTILIKMTEKHYGKV